MTYQRKYQMFQLDQRDPEIHTALADIIKAHGLTHLQTTSGDVVKIRGVNKKSVAIDSPSAHYTRVEFPRIDSLGVLEGGNEVDEAIESLKTKVSGISISVSKSPVAGSDHGVATAVEEAAKRSGVLTEEGEKPHHAERAHALLSASSAHRWLNCPPSAVLADQQPAPADSPAAAQGTAAHELAEHKLRKHLKLRSTYPASDLIDEEMQELTDDYVTYVMEQYEEARQRSADAQIMVEQRLDFSDIVPDGFGTGDCIIISDGVMHVIDLKYGLGVLVDAEDNPQMKLYALGAMNLFGYLYDVSEVAMTIYQPRRANISTATITVEELQQWAAEVVQPTAALAAEGKGEFSAGEWCGFCPIRATCRARAEKNLELAKMEFAKPAELSESEIAEVLNQLPELKKWAGDVEKHASSMVIDHGKELPGFKVVAGRSVRKYSDVDAVAVAAQSAGYVDIYDRKLIGITAMEKLMGKPTFNEVLGELIVKPEGKPTLVPVSDRRPAIEVKTSASDDFGDAA
ncbi:DUF2800 domain-containing protein [Corynebacterium sp. H113]|uniref:DUF2800 domain-containing protein n=1 Tax=Corynebacterium sp. H113 TaxID=3133419 RepID=UPI0030B0D522